MLLKTARTVLVPAIAGRDYHPYFKTCPAPPPPPHVKRWVSKQLCGTISKFAFYGYVTPTTYEKITETVVAIAGLPNVTSFDKSFLTTMPTTEPALIYQAPYCTVVNVYE